MFVLYSMKAFTSFNIQYTDYTDKTMEFIYNKYK